jgi:hypothetical protein
VNRQIESSDLHCRNADELIFEVLASQALERTKYHGINEIPRRRNGATIRRIRPGLSWEGNEGKIWKW